MHFRNRLSETIFEQHRLVFFGVTLCLLGLFALAAVHEMLPGFCTADEEGEDCPFCTLVFTLVLAVCLALFLPECALCRRQASLLFTELRLAHIRYAGWLRAPPAPFPT